MIVSGLFFFFNVPYIFIFLMSLYWIADLCWELRVLIDYSLEVKNKGELSIYIYFIITDIIYFGIFFLFSILTWNFPENSLLYLGIIFSLFCLFRLIDDYPIKKWQKRRIEHHKK